jgi:uroporphyrinogen-III synthase
VVFTSANAVERFVPLLRDARAFGAAQIAAIGTGTAAALAARNLSADLLPERFVAESLLEAFAALPDSPGRVLLPRAAGGRDVLPEGLRRLGWEVDVVEAYRTTTPVPPPGLKAAARRADAVTFTSSSTVTGYVAALGPKVPPVVACIGPVTARTARGAGFEVTVVAEEHTVAGLIRALTGALVRATARPGPP